ncbi:hypothetical protein [Paenibacillus fonticola]|uniref:hypothetical protein n=1 Tax=Paenibacillus fonticola TaxID=379896 RepID=UPI00035E3063|nr:hypothetical protein [Paenibacillus fonticola]
MFKLRTFEEIVGRLKKRQTREKVRENFSEDYLWVCQNLSDHLIAADHILLSYETAKKYNTEYASHFKSEQGMWIFAKTGQGDLWLIPGPERAEEDAVYFYDHDLENYQAMHIHLKEWFVLADLMAQKENLFHTESTVYFDENLDLKEPYRLNFISEIEKIKTGLSAVYPFEI